MELYLNDSKYPGWLKEIHHPPACLYINGELTDGDRFAVAMVGSRNATLYGMQVAEKLAYDLARKGLTVVSGLARGIDSAAHRGALRAGGRTIAVLGCGLDRIYPKENTKLAKEIATQGCVISEYPGGTDPRPLHFPLRNRIISGLSLGVIVVEASRRSGSLITVQHAIEQGRQIFAVPGPVDSLLSEGAHTLIKEGAKLVDTAEDVFEDLAPLMSDLERAKEKTLNRSVGNEEKQSAGASAEANYERDGDSEEIKKVLRVITTEELCGAYIAEAAGIPQDQLYPLLIRLELEGRIARSFGGTYRRLSAVSS